MTKSVSRKVLLEQYEFLVPLVLFILFLVLTLPGISWGAPDVWHPDEIVVRSIKALHGEWQFSEINFDYPDLPQYAMLFLGKLMLALGKTDGDILVASRVLSAVLAGLTVILTYIIARRIGGSIFVAGLSGLLLISVSEMPHNGRFAHNDTYIVFFTTLSVLCLLNYVNNHNKLWLYASFVTVGMAASSKYIGGSLVLAPLTVYLIEQRHTIRKQWLPFLETLFISAAVTFLGFALGTPKALFWMTYYFKRLFSTLQWQVNYGYQPDSVHGIFGQYGVMANGLGLALVLLFGLGFAWAVWRVAGSYRTRTLAQEPQTRSYAILLLAILALDLPMMISYNYQLRYFLTLMPFLAVLTAFFIERIYQQAKQTNKSAYPIAIGVTVSVIILYSLARVVSLMLLVMNDARIPASAFMDTLPPGKTLEHTYYPPAYDGSRFEREHNYPVYFVRGDEPLPTDKRFEYNAGEAGLDDRRTDYFIVDSFTSDKFDDPHYCDSMPVECAFFKQLETGGSDHYKLLKEFKYTLPPYLPQINFEFLNPSIRIYERIP
ncbi:MAG: phospholipid carrier-dependent glycosyltransferase [Anaerolineales bacterium]|nr:phospholipid carrier-dependent glycosyltransferase [Anaerolineales bacterium]NUQ83946.1 phospholipid carrier-dependent glycosyltransferase [Anaerolineales bacterium]